MFRSRLFLPALLLAIACCAVADLVDDAVTAFQRGDLPAAEQALRADLKTHPADARALGLLAVVLDSEKQYDEAADCYRRALAMSPRSAGLLNNFGNHLLAAGDARGARAAFAKVLALDPSHANANLQLAKLALDAREAADALRFLDRLPYADRQTPPVAMLRMQALYLAGRNNEADAILAGFGATDPRLSFSAALALAGANQFDKAEQFFSRALEASPGDFDVLYNLGLAASHAGHYERAQHVLSIALSQRPQDADVLYSLAVVDGALKQNDAALTLLAQASRIAPNRAPVQQLLARTAMDLGYYADAALAWDQYAKLAPSDDEARRERGFALALSGQASKGEMDLKWYAARHPQDVTGQYELGAAETRTDSNDALVHLNRALTLQPDFVPARFSRAVLYAEAGKPERALPDLQFAVAHDAGNPNLLDRLGQTYTALDRFSDAITALRKAAELAPDNGRILLHLSRALAGAGQDAESRAVIQRYRNLGPDRRRHPSAGLVAFLSLSPEQQDAQYRARLKSRLDSDPENPVWLLEQLKLLLADEKTEDADAAAVRFSAVHPSATLAAAAGRALLEARHYASARQLLEQAVAEGASADARLDLALADFHTAGPPAALAEMDRIPEAQRNGDYYLARASMRDAAGAAGDAASDLDRALRAAPRRAALYRDAAVFLIRHRKIAAALSVVEQAARILPEDPSILLLDATTLEIAEKTDQAQHVLEQLQSRWPEWADAYVSSGIILATHRRYADARRQLETALALGADGAPVWYYLADATYHASPDEMDAALRDVNRALAFDPENAWAHALAGRIAFEQEHYQDAAKQLAEAVRLRPHMLQAHYDLARTWSILGRKAEEQAEIERVRVIREQHPSGDEDPVLTPDLLLSNKP